MNDDVDDRYERRLVEETSRIRVEVSGVETRLTERIAQSEAALRQDMAGVRTDVGSLELRLTDRIAQSEAGLRHDMAGLEVRMERSVGALRSDLFKWSFVFWIGQVAVMTGILSVLLPR